MLTLDRVIRTALAGCALAVAACSTGPQQAPLPVASGLPAEILPDGAVYKVGNPYQIEGIWYYPSEDYAYIEEGTASWYGADFHGKRTANGEIYDMNALTAAHPTLPMPSVINVTNLDNGRSIKLRVNDRGPFKRSRVLDVSRRAAQLLGFQNEGTARVRIVIDAEESMMIKNQALRLAPQELPQVAAAPRGNVSSVSLEPVGGPGAPQLSAASAPLPQLPSPASAPLPAPVQAIPDMGVNGTFIQAGAFADESNAMRLQQQLRELGNVFIVPTFVDGRQLFRVRLGPLAEEMAEGILQRVRNYGYGEALIVRY